ncbi:dnaJ homolog subfamily C member 25 homolog isoform X2 [Uloborus diversus]|uniref:dnaJ homolog subfamily C member 25 homolog isoform X2 n=1 Tax=Uloborus diversus TaxID=327109 RepID=UPI0024098E80|nr:dnaJ homolog subfamily C member 25 homolog isoform X2 [Uloborus diversus]
MLFNALFVIIALLYSPVNGLIDGLYCGKHNCYSVLGVERDASKAEIAKAYRQLARRYHPDMQKGAEAKRKASEKFTLIATAYETLKDEETRKDYDYMLDNPDKVYGHYYRYYRRQMSPKVDARIVIAVSITVISIIQYLGAWQRYKSAIDHLISVPKYRMKEQIKEEEEAILKKILEQKMDIRGGYSKPSITDVLWIKLIFLPYVIAKYIIWKLRWIWKFVILKQEYGDEEKLYLIKKHMKCSETQWDAIPGDEKEECFEEELWIKDNFVKWKQKKEEEMKLKLAESARYKSYRRYMKNHGPGQITLDD